MGVTQVEDIGTADIYRWTSMLSIFMQLAKEALGDNQTVISNQIGGTKTTQV
jgi:hypothetical protein